MADLEIIECTSPTELFRHYDGQSEAQAAYIELDLRDGQLLADYNGEIGNGVPFSVYHGFQRRWSIPVLTADAANRIMREIAPLAARMLADWEEVWDGNNHIARLGEDALAADDEIDDLLGLRPPYRRPFEEADLVGQWDLDGATNGCEADEYSITATTSDKRLQEIEQEILQDLAGCGDSPVAVCDGLGAYLKDLREQAADDLPESGLTVEGPDDEVAVWSVVRGSSPTARAVEPGPAGVDVPDEILAWAGRHGLSDDDPEVYLLVTPRNEAGEILGEIVWREYRATPDDMTALSNALNSPVN
ncbi:hypothetical protein [Streptomyces sp. NBC_01789]|uniref:hypothetical protein n=1 Tax=Streptomyces sp. NBC_01789 TaxID=2975941 RepID=UPI00224F42CE|nr:hypothetical protein [Streptomyces sp. NBC_01789]MCX4451625.1 hypothetical protein [Streptomyces sp. NBC_01789]